MKFIHFLFEINFLKQWKKELFFEGEGLIVLEFGLSRTVGPLD